MGFRGFQKHPKMGAKSKLGQVVKTVFPFRREATLVLKLDLKTHHFEDSSLEPSPETCWENLWGAGGSLEHPRWGGAWLLAFLLFHENLCSRLHRSSLGAQRISQVH